MKGMESKYLFLLLEDEVAIYTVAGGQADT